MLPKNLSVLLSFQGRMQYKTPAAKVCQIMV
jgi:hypothetical protein